MTDQALDAWLARLERRSPESGIRLGLDRVGEVFRRLVIDFGDRPVITIGGTNGKGSTVAFLERIYQAAGWRPFAYTSPHLVDFHERMRIDGQPADDPLIVQALDRVESARGDVFLTYFEHITLAALCVAEASPVDVLVLEVGLGGRLDAVNIVDPDVTVVTSIGLDHTEWLGRTRLEVGREKLGIARSGKPLIVGEKQLPAGLGDELRRTGATVFRAGQDFRWRAQRHGFTLTLPGRRVGLPEPAMAGRWQRGNAACAVMAVHTLMDRLPVPDVALATGMKTARLAGRLQRLSDSPEVLVDVAHNAAAARALAVELGPAKGRSCAVFSALAGKDVRGIGRALNSCFDHWLVAPLAGDRARSGAELVAELERIPVKGGVEAVESVSEAIRRALDRSRPSGRVVVFGSFRTVAEAWPELKLLRQRLHG
ncbi:MAG: bifunctional folylpolyglutamate synthase/dihydrofolate synthase [Wenzhouxiangella sp.]